MRTNPLLYIALLSSRVASALLYLAMLVVIGFFVHFQLAPAQYRSVQVSTQGGAISVYEGKVEPIAERSKPETAAKTLSSSCPCGQRRYLNELTSLSVYTAFLQVLGSIILSLMMLKEVSRILNAVRNSQIFSLSNSLYFRRLAWLCLAMAALNSVRMLATAHDSSVSFNPGIPLLLFMIAAFIMAEIFKEGHSLAERDRLTI